MSNPFKIIIKERNFCLKFNTKSEHVHKTENIRK